MMTIATYAGVVRKGQIQLLEPVTLPEDSQVFVIVPTPIDERLARRKANRWLIENVGNMVMADHAALMWPKGRAVWRFGAFVTAVSHTPEGPIGYVEVDANTGDVTTSLEAAGEMIEHGEHLARAS